MNPKKVTLFTGFIFLFSISTGLADEKTEPRNEDTVAERPKDKKTNPEPTGNNNDQRHVGTFRFVNGILHVKQPVEPVQPVQPVQPIQSPTPATSETGSITGLIDLSLGAPTAFTSRIDTAELPPERQIAAGGDVAGDVIVGSESAVLGTTDTGDLLRLSNGDANYYSRSLSPIINQPWIRGYRYGQIRSTLNGAAWFPIRPDLDTPLGRFDSSIVRDIIITKGPYSVRQGPGFSFIDVALHETPRHENGFQWGGHTGLSFDTNGDQWSGRQAFWGGGADRGWRVGYSHRIGNDYETGGGFNVASSYNIRDWDFAYGLDLSRDSSVEFNYIRSDMTDVELPSQVNDLEFLKSDGFSLTYTLENQCYYDKLTIDSWHNQSSFLGTPNNKGSFFSFVFPQTFGFNSSSGTRVAMTWGNAETGAASIGADYTRTKQRYVEDPFYGIPNTTEEDTGIFADAILPLTQKLTLKAGGRVDWVQSDANQGPDPPPFPSRNSFFSDDSQSFTLGAGYLSAEYEIDRVWTADIGFGIGERIPTATDLYAFLPYLSILQEGGLFFVEGNRLLRKETAKQVDLGLSWDTCCFRGGIHGFYSWIDDFVTYNSRVPTGPNPNNRQFGTINTDATLSGGEIYGEYDLSRAMTLFGNLSYTEGRDQEINEPLWMIPPLESRLGVRITQPCPQPKWAIEYVARVVDNQDRLSTAGFVGESATPGFTTHDIRGYYRINEAVTFISGVENIGDRLYLEHLDSRENYNNFTGATPTPVYRPGRNFYFAVQSKY